MHDQLADGRALKLLCVIEPHVWLTDVLTRLPTTRNRDIDTLLPLS